MKKQSFLSRLLSNGYVLFGFALIISLVAWFYMSFTSSATDTTYVINDVPIQTDLSDEAKNLKLQMFISDENKASVTVSGNRTAIGLVHKNDVNVTAATGSINSPGNYTLAVTANKRSNISNFEIKSVTPSSIPVMVDYYKESDFQIQDGIVYKAADDYYSAVSFEKDTIKISGPQSEVLKIKKVTAKAELSGTVKSTNEIDAEIVLLDEKDNEISSKYITLSDTSVKATITVLPQKTVPVKPVFTGKPEGLTLSNSILTVQPKEIVLAGPEESLKSVESVMLEPIDFSNVENKKNVFENLGFTVPEQCKVINNETTAKITLDLSSMASKKLTVSQFTTEGLSSDYTSEITSKSISVTVIGSKSDIEKLTASNVTAVLDTSDFSGKTGSVEMPVTIRFSGVNTCWALGSYQANVTITKK